VYHAWWAWCAAFTQLVVKTWLLARHTMLPCVVCSLLLCGRRKDTLRKKLLYAINSGAGFELS
jgi:hypothetical protein